MMHAAGSGETRKFSQAHFTPPEFEFDSFTPGGNTTLARSRWQHCLLDRKTNCMPSSEFRARWLDLQGRTSGFLKIFLSLVKPSYLPFKVVFSSTLMPTWSYTLLSPNTIF